MVAWWVNRVPGLAHWCYGCQSSLLKTTLLGESLLAHQSSKLRERQKGPLQPFDRNLLEKPLAMSNNENLLVGIDTQIDVLADPVQVHIVTSFGDTHGAILANLADKVLAMDMYQPGVRINGGRK